MRSKLIGYVIALTVSLALSTVAFAQPRKHKGSESGGDKTMDKQMDWERKVMGEDHGKQADMKKIAAAQKLADEAAKNPPPVQAPKVKDPNKEGVRAKQEASIGLPIASDNEPSRAKKTSTAKKAAEPSSSANDELGALVASSLAEERSGDAKSSSQSKSSRTKAANGGKGKRGKASASSAPSTLDSMFAASK